VRLHFSANRPEESSHFPSNCHGDDGLALAARHELTVAAAEPDLGFPGDVADRFG